MPAEIAIQSSAQKVTGALESIGCKIEEVVKGTGILFVYGGQYYVASAAEDLTYLCVYFPKFGDVSGFPSRLSADDAIHELNARAQLARVWIDRSQLHASAETLLEPSMQLTSVLERLLKTLQHIVFEARVFQRFAGAQKGNSEPDNPPPEVSHHPMALH